MINATDFLQVHKIHNPAEGVHALVLTEVPKWSRNHYFQNNLYLYCFFTAYPNLGLFPGITPKGRSGGHHNIYEVSTVALWITPQHKYSFETKVSNLLSRNSLVSSLPLQEGSMY